LRFFQSQQYVRGQSRGSVWGKVFACVWLVIVISCTPNFALAQTAELDGVSSLVQHGKLQEAEQRLQRYLQTHPRSAEANKLLGAIYLRQGQFEQAEVVLQKAVVAAPTLLEPRVDLGDAFLASGKLDSALVAYQDAAKIAPADARVNLALAKLYLGKGEFSKSLQAAGNIPAAKRTGELLPTLAADYLGLGQPEKAEVEIQAMLNVAEKQPDLVPELAEFLLAHRDFKSSQQLLALAQGKQPVTDRLQIDLALTQAGMDHLDEAQETLERVLEHKPDSVEALVAAGQVASQQLNWAAAAEAFSRAESLAPDRPEILYGLVSAQLYGNRAEAALENARRLHSMVPDDPRSAYLLALALFGANKGEESKRYAEQVLVARPEDREMHLILADIALNDERDWSSALKQADVCLKQNPNDPGGLYYRGMAQKMAGDIGAAIQSLAKSVAANPNNADAQGALGALCLGTGDLQRAVSTLEQAVLLAPDEAQHHYQLALAYSRSGAEEKARVQLGIYQQIKARQAKEAKGPSTTEIPHMGVARRP
jgi:tetratricopeptide (TPR) repeat protein